MIVVYGRMDDPPIARLIKALQEAGVEYALVELTALEREHLRIEIGPHGVDGCLVVAEQEIPMARIRSVYARPLELPKRWSTPGAASRVRILHEQFLQWLDVARALVVSRPRAMQFNASKPLQAQLIGEAGFAVPQTLVTNDETEARAFWREHGRVIFKSVSGVRSIVQELDEHTAQRLDRLALLPTQFQAYVPGVDVRVHVVGERTFATEIRSPATDDRYASRAPAKASLARTQLPHDVTERCVALAERMELPLAGIDLRRRPDGEFVCFEVNPMPAYTYDESHTGLPISQALAALLIGSDKARQEDDHGAGNRKSHADQRHGACPQAASAPS
ncbi:MAG TPA: alpha-L-glutamate ligase [Candidatus Eisenbacteria bacterium]|nr:alpha-L-glutamate ligase [Candidatus Eisenbacteria bacterium]